MTALTRFTGLQRLLHWLMAICIIAMLFIGVGMVSTVMPSYLPLFTTHKILGSAILVLALLRLGVRLSRGAPPLPASLPEPIAHGLLCPDDRHAAARLGDAVHGRLPDRAMG